MWINFVRLRDKKYWVKASLSSAHECVLMLNGTRKSDILPLSILCGIDPLRRENNSNANTNSSKCLCFSVEGKIFFFYTFTRIIFHNFQLHNASVSIVCWEKGKRSFLLVQRKNLFQLNGEKCVPDSLFQPSHSALVSASLHICLPLALAQTNRFASCLECQYHC